VSDAIADDHIDRGVGQREGLRLALDKTDIDRSSLRGRVCFPFDHLHQEVDPDDTAPVRTFVGLDGPRAGFTAIRATGWVKSPNGTTEQLEELCQYVQNTSPVRDCLANPIPVTTDLVILD
jgi:hypothetical protein